MGRKAKCWACQKQGDTDEMVNLSTNSQKQYYHTGECEQKRLKHMEFLKQDNAERDELNELIKEIHGIDLIPHNFWSLYLQPLRNGEEVKYAQRKKKYKEGFTYKEMADAYEYCRKAISIGVKKINNSKKPFAGAMFELSYGFAIMIDKISLVKKRKAKVEHKKQVSEARENMQEKNLQESPIEEREYKYKKRKDNGVDLSKLLG